MRARRPRARLARAHRVRASARALGLAAAWCAAPRANADAPIRAEADRLTVLEHAPRAPTAARYVLDAPLPPLPFRRITAQLPEGLSITTNPVLAADATVVLGASTPNTMLWVRSDGTLAARAELEFRPVDQPAVGADGRIYAASEAGRLLLVAPDGTMRGSLRMPGLGSSRPQVFADGTVFTYATESSSSRSGALTHTALWLSRELDVLATRPLVTVRGEGTPAAAQYPYFDGGGCVWMLLGEGMTCFRANGTRSLVAGTARTAAAFVLDAQSLVTQAGTELTFRDLRTGAVRTRVDLGVTSPWIQPLPGHGLGVVRLGAAADLVLYDSAGQVRTRTPLSSAAVQGVLVDPTGAQLVVYSTGELVVHEPDGALRWRVDLRDTVTRAPLALPGGRVALVTVSARLQLLVP